MKDSKKYRSHKMLMIFPLLLPDTLSTCSVVGDWVCMYEPVWTITSVSPLVLLLSLEYSQWDVHRQRRERGWGA